MPTPVKYSNTEIRAAYKSIEKNAAERLVSQLTQEMRPAYTSLLAGEYGELGAIIKAADKISAYIKCLEEQKTGNSEFRLAAVQTKAKIDAMCLPEADYFMQHYIPAFSLTLDELEN
jgi:5'-deoxynucleotidase